MRSVEEVVEFSGEDPEMVPIIRDAVAATARMLVYANGADPEELVPGPYMGEARTLVPRWREAEERALVQVASTMAGISVIIERVMQKAAAEAAARVPLQSDMMPAKLTQFLED